MATSPTVLAGAPTSPSQTSVPTAAEAKFPLVSMLLAVASGAVISALAAGVVVYWMASSGRLVVQEKATQKREVIAPVTTRVMTLEPFLVNLADPGGSSYLRIALTLRIADTSGKKDDKDKSTKAVEDAVSPVRDTVIAVLGQQTAEGLLATDGKEHLKSDLKAALARHNMDLKTTDVFFTDFLVQR